eukprot:Nk52_evm13s539 gene=Nk52_evmTU13s539
MQASRVRLSSFDTLEPVRINPDDLPLCQDRKYLDEADQVEGFGWDLSSSLAAQRSLISKFFTRLNHIAITGFGLFANMYDISVIDVVKNIIADEYDPTDFQLTLVAISALMGTIVGTILFGSAADYLGRKKMCIISAVGAIVCSLGSAFSFGSDSFSIFYTLSIWRFFLGIAIGGEYPLSALLANETVTARESARAMNISCSLMVLGIIVAPSVILVCFAAGASNSFTWRFSLGFGAVPSLILLALRLRMLETKKYIESKAKSEADRFVIGLSQFRSSRNLLRYFYRPLLSCAISWFLYDFISFSMGLFNGTITAELGLGQSVTEQAKNVLLVNMFYLPGTILGIFIMDRVGRKHMQVLGFVGMGALFVIIGIYLQVIGKDSEHDWLLLVFYGFTKSFDQIARYPIYASSAEMFPTIIRGFCHGIASGTGKVGALLGTSFNLPLQNLFDLDFYMITFGAISFVGVFWTLFTMPGYSSESLEEISQCDDIRALLILYPNDNSIKNMVDGAVEHGFRSSVSSKSEDENAPSENASLSSTTNADTAATNSGPPAKPAPSGTRDRDYSSSEGGSYELQEMYPGTEDPPEEMLSSDGKKRGKGRLMNE